MINPNQLQTEIDKAEKLVCKANLDYLQAAKEEEEDKRIIRIIAETILLTLYKIKEG